MTMEFDPSAIRADLGPAGDNWAVAIETASHGSWGHADKAWSTHLITQSELRQELGDEGSSDVQQVIGYVEVTLRRAGWRAVRGGDPATPTAVETWDLSPASDYR